jgi:hypothetical protein
MGRKGSGLICYSELQGGSPHLCQLRPASVEPWWISIWIVLTHTGHMESLNWVASCVTAVYIGIVHGSPTVCPPRHTRGRRALGWGGAWSSPWPHRELLSLVVPFGPASVVLSGLYPCKVDDWFESLWHPQTWVMACSLCWNVELSTS